MKWLNKLTNSFKKASLSLSENVKKIATHKKLAENTIEQFEEMLIAADLGFETAQKICKVLRQEKFGQNIDDKEILHFLQKEIAIMMKDAGGYFNLPDLANKKERSKKPYVILLCGVNGSGKTTTIGKFAVQFRQQGYSVMIAGCDTFRAAASEQLITWSQRAQDCHVVLAPQQGADPASIAYKALDKATQENIDILLIDTGGRLHNNKNLMEELKKCTKVVKKIDPLAPHDTILVIDGTTGQNAHLQVELFGKAIDITGLVITKLDGSSKGGVIINISQKYKIPIYAIGIGEGIDDLNKFDSKDFVSALVNLQGGTSSQNI